MAQYARQVSHFPDIEDLETMNVTEIDTFGDNIVIFYSGGHNSELFAAFYKLVEKYPALELINKLNLLCNP